MIQTTIGIDGMMCEMCEAHIKEAVRKAIPEAQNVKADRHKKMASFITEAPVDAEALKKAITDTGYDAGEVESRPYEKKGGLFGKLFGK